MVRKLITLMVITGIALFAFGACGSAGSDDQGSQSGAAETSAEASVIPPFETVDLEGNTVDNSIFAEADITVINIWGTFCPPCIEEMPELAEWSGQMPDNVQIIGVLCDVESEDAAEYETALELVAETGVGYPNLLAAEGLDTLLDEVIGVPTTFFVDSEGKILCDEIVGADVEGYKKTVESLL